MEWEQVFPVTSQGLDVFYPSLPLPMFCSYKELHKAIVFTPSSVLSETTEFEKAGVKLKAQDLIKQMTVAKLLCTETLYFQSCFVALPYLEFLMHYE